MAGDLKAGRVIVHFGMPKTGSSSLRASFSRHLRDPRFYFVNLGNPNASRGLAAGFMADPARFPYFKNAGLSTDELNGLRSEALEKISAELKAAAGRTALFSAEAVFGFSEPEFRNLHQFIGGRVRAVTAVGYIRRPKEFMESNFQQQIKGAYSTQLVPANLLADYRGRVRKFNDVLGEKNVALWLFDPKSFPGGCVVQDFCARLGIKFPRGRVIRTNEGLSLPALSLLFAYRKFGAGHKPGPTLFRENALLTSHLAKLPGPKLRLHSSVVAPIIKGKSEEIAWIEARLGASMAEDLAAHDDHAIRSEADLLKFSPETLRWLAEQLGPDYVARRHARMTPQEVAEWMHVLRARVAGSSAGR